MEINVVYPWWGACKWQLAEWGASQSGGRASTALLFFSCPRGKTFLFFMARRPCFHKGS